MPVKGVRKGNKQQISLTIAPGLLVKVDELAAQLGQSRAAVINLAIYRMVEHGVMIEP
jgi:biotin operon repressor